MLPKTLFKNIKITDSFDEFSCPLFGTSNKEYNFNLEILLLFK